MTFQQRAQDLLLVERLCTAARRRPAAAPPAGAADYDWGRPCRFTRAERGRLDALAAKAAARAAAELGAALRAEVALESSPAAERYTASLALDEVPAYYLELREASARPAGLVRLPAFLAAAWIDKLLGGGARAGGPVRRLSAMETTLLGYISGALAAALSAASQECGGPALKEAPAITTVPPPGVLGAQDAEVCQFTLRPTSPPQEDRNATDIVVLLRSDLLEAVAGPSPAPRPLVRPEDVRAAILGHFAKTRVTITARVGTADVLVRDLVSLEPGDVIVLRTGREEPITLTVDGVAILRGRPAQSQGLYAVRVEQCERRPRLTLAAEPPTPRKETRK
jgi:flagellar motor switch protein FliM